jgi:hypothetical protein
VSDTVEIVYHGPSGSVAVDEHVMVRGVPTTVPRWVLDRLRSLERSASAHVFTVNDPR